MTQEGDRRVWAALGFRVRRRGRHRCGAREPAPAWTQGAAREEAETWAAEMNLGPLVWESPDDQLALGRARGHVAVVRSVLLPLGSPEEERRHSAMIRRTFS